MCCRSRPSTAFRSPVACSTTARSGRIGTSRSTSSTAASSAPSSLCSRTSPASRRRVAATVGGSPTPPRWTRRSPRRSGPTSRASRRCWTSWSPGNGCSRAGSTSGSTRKRRRARCDPDGDSRRRRRCAMLVNFGQPLGGVVQFAYTVPDLDQAISDYATRLKIGPWFVRGPFQPDKAFYRGEPTSRSEEHTSELQSPYDLVCRLLLEKKKKTKCCLLFQTKKKNKH